MYVHVTSMPDLLSCCLHAGHGVVASVQTMDGLPRLPLMSLSCCLHADPFEWRHVACAMLAGGICPNLVEFFDAFWEDPFMYLAMEYMDHGYVR